MGCRESLWLMLGVLEVLFPLCPNFIWSGDYGGGGSMVVKVIQALGQPEAGCKPDPSFLGPLWSCAIDFFLPCLFPPP